MLVVTRAWTFPRVPRNSVQKKKNVYTIKRDRVYYKVWQVLQSVASRLLQSVASCYYKVWQAGYYKVWHYKLHVVSSFYNVNFYDGIAVNRLNYQKRKLLFLSFVPAWLYQEAYNKMHTICQTSKILIFRQNARFFLCMPQVTPSILLFKDAITLLKSTLMDTLKSASTLREFICIHLKGCSTKLSMLSGI